MGRVKTAVKRIAPEWARRAYRWLRPLPAWALPHRAWAEVQDRLAEGGRIVDLGCGARPHPCATMAVDRYLEPAQRLLGGGAGLSADTFERLGVRFVKADLENLPFGDKEFDYARSSHAFEHLPDPKRACEEMARVARAGVIITPSIFAEHAFGRPYHHWMVLARGDTLIFVKKVPELDRPFGDHPRRGEEGKFEVTPESNPFDLLLNNPGWYKGRERMPRLAKLLQRYSRSHHPVMEVVFQWEDDIRCVVIDEHGAIH